MRIELEDGDWAEVRPPNKIPHGITMEYREAFFEVVAAGAGDGTKAILTNGALMADQRATNAFVLAIVKEWSFGPVDTQTMMTVVPTASLDAIVDAVDLDDYRKVLTPGFKDSMDREPGSPT